MMFEDDEFQEYVDAIKYPIYLNEDTHVTYFEHLMEKVLKGFEQHLRLHDEFVKWCHTHGKTP